MTRLGEVGTFERGRRFTKDQYVESGLGCIHYGQLYTHLGPVTTEALTFLPNELRGRLRLAAPGDVVVAATSENVADLGKATAWLGVDDVAVHDDCYIFRHGMDPTFASHLFASSAFQEQKVQFAAGTKVTRISGANLAKIQVSIPSLREQRRIVDVMAAVDAQVEALAGELARQLSLRVRLLVNFDDLSDIAVEEVASVSQGKALPKSVQGDRSGDISWFKISDMNGPGNEDGYTIADTRLSREQVRLLKGVVIPLGAVVFPRVGAAVLTEKKRILDVDAAVDENQIVLTPKDGVSPECLLAAVESIRLAGLVQTGAVPSLNMELIRRAQIPWSDKANSCLNDVLAEMRSNARVLRAELAHLRTLRSTILSALLNQEIEIPESYDALLEGTA